MSEYHNVASSLNLGWSPTSTTNIRATARNNTTAIGLPGAYDFYLIPNDGKQSDQDLYVSTSIDNQTTENWHNLVRYGLARKREQADQWYAAGIPITTIQFGSPTLNYYGLPVLIKGANGYQVAGQAQLNSGFGTYPNCLGFLLQPRPALRPDRLTKSRRTSPPSATSTTRDERGSQNYPTYDISESTERPNYDYTAQFSGDFKNRVFYQLGGGIQKNHLYGVQGTPRASVAYYLQRPGAGIIHGTKLNFNSPREFASLRCPNSSAPSTTYCSPSPAARKPSSRTISRKSEPSATAPTMAASNKACSMRRCSSAPPTSTTNSATRSNTSTPTPSLSCSPL